MRILVAGGAGYIGSHMTLLLLEAGHEVQVVDNLSTGFRDAVPPGVLIEADLADRSRLHAIFRAQRFDAVMHFAACTQVGESSADPAKYYRNNVAHTLNLLDAMIEHRVMRLVFSSSAAIFGEPQYVPVDEAHPQRPTNPYGWSKCMVEQVLADYERAYGLRHSCLRYFNAAGADPQARLGERHHPETHLIPLVLRAASGRGGAVRILGTDYGTPDGTCLRDYVHVIDLCEAHLLALERLGRGQPSRAYNLGNGTAYSVKQVIDTARRVTGSAITVGNAPRRPGDPARLIADSTRALNELGWRPRYAALETIIRHAWDWEKKAAAREMRAAAV